MIIFFLKFFLCPRTLPSSHCYHYFLKYYPCLLCLYLAYSPLAFAVFLYTIATF